MLSWVLRLIVCCAFSCLVDQLEAGDGTFLFWLLHLIISESTKCYELFYNYFLSGSPNKFLPYRRKGKSCEVFFFIIDRKENVLHMDHKTRACNLWLICDLSFYNICCIELRTNGTQHDRLKPACTWPVLLLQDHRLVQAPFWFLP